MLQKYMSTDRLIVLVVFNPLGITMQTSGLVPSVLDRSKYTSVMQWFKISQSSHGYYNGKRVKMQR
jgi:hypothetical protein